MLVVSGLCLARGCQQDAETPSPQKRAEHGCWGRQEMGAAGTPVPRDRGISVPVRGSKRG